MGRIVENLWDCQYCGTRGNRGRDYVCPNCGKTRDESVKFYLPETITYYDKPIEKGPDWYCPYCDSYNRYSSNNCKNCGAERSNQNYFDIQQKKEKPKDEIELPQRLIDPAPITYHTPTVIVNLPKKEIPKVEKKIRRLNIQWSWKRFFAFLILLLIIGTIIAAIPRWETITVNSSSWKYQIDIETNTLVEESDWSTPSDAVEVLYTRREIHHYDQVIDHYKTVTETKSRQVLDGYDTYYTYRDLGNGFSEQVAHQTPKYRTEYYTETHQEPVYREDPVYRTKYYYTVWRYVYDHTETTTGDYTIEPYWADYTFIGDQRESGRREIYQINFNDKNEKTVTYYVKDYDLWKKLTPGGTYYVKVSLKHIIEIKGDDK